jgi:hypothetical protein
MTSFVKPKKSSPTVDTKFTISNISPPEIDKTYTMSLMPDLTAKKLRTSAVVPQPQVSNTFGSTSTLSLIKGIKPSSSNLPRDEKLEQKTAISFRLQNANLTREREFIPTILTHTMADEKDIKKRIIVCPDIKRFENKSVEVFCWYCRLYIQPDIYALPLPISFKEEKFEGEGFFCSFNCMLAYTNDFCSGQHRYKNCGTLIHLLYQRIFETNIMLKQITPSPSWKLLKTYGGHLTNEEYRKHIQLNRFISLNQRTKEALIIEIHPEMFQSLHEE